MNIQIKTPYAPPHTSFQCHETQGGGGADRPPDPVLPAFQMVSEPCHPRSLAFRHCLRVCPDGPHLPVLARHRAFRFQPLSIGDGGASLAPSPSTPPRSTPSSSSSTSTLGSTAGTTPCFDDPHCRPAPFESGGFHGRTILRWGGLTRRFGWGE